MGKQKEAAETFISSIADEKLTGLPRQTKTIASDSNFRLDMQGMTSDKPPKHNLQMQVNYNPKLSSLKPFAPATCARSMVDSEKPKSSGEIKNDLISTFKVEKRNKNKK